MSGCLDRLLDQDKAVQVEKGRLVRPYHGQVLGVREAPRQRRDIVEPEFGDAVVLHRRQTGQLDWNGMLLQVAAHRRFYRRD